MDKKLEEMVILGQLKDITLQIDKYCQSMKCDECIFGKMVIGYKADDKTLDMCDALGNIASYFNENPDNNDIT